MRFVSARAAAVDAAGIFFRGPPEASVLEQVRFMDFFVFFGYS
jgi:hypothetical protein